MSNLYQKLNSYKILRRSYSLKFLAVAFLGIHLPVIALIIAVQMATDNTNPWTLIFIVLAVTLVSTVITLFILRELTLPIREIAADVEAYSSSRKLPVWRKTGEDEVSQLMAYVEKTLYNLEDQLIRQEDTSLLLTHDLRTPISAAINALDVLQEMDKEEQKQHMTELRSYLVNQLSFIDAVLQIIKYESVSEKTALQNVDVEDLVESASLGLKHRIQLKELDYSTSLERGHILCDPVMMRQILTNVLSNAIKYTPTRGTIKISGSKVGHDTYELAVTDSGRGLTPDEISKIFNRSLKEEMLGTNGEDSRGLGLYLTQTLVRRQGGRIFANSDGPGRGSTFYLSFKLGSDK